MKKGIFTAVLLAMTMLSFGQVDFTEVKTQNDWDKVLSLAESEGKNIFIDVYADWCGYCKMMDRDVFSSKTLGKSMGESFVSVKMDADAGFGSDFSWEHDISGLPTFMILSPNEEVLGRLSGYHSEDQLLASLEPMRAQSRPIGDMMKDFKAGKLSSEEQISLARRMKFSEAEGWEDIAAEVSISLLKKDELKESEMDFIAYHGVAIGDEVFKQVIASKEKLDQYYLDEYLFELMMLQLNEAISSRDIAELNPINEQVLPHYASNEEEEKLFFGALKRMYLAEVEDWKGYDELVRQERKDLYADSEHYFYNEASDLLDLVHYTNDPLELAFDYLELYAADFKDDFDTYLMMSYTKYLLDDNTEAKKLLATAKSLASTTDQKEAVSEVEGLLAEY